MPTRNETALQDPKLLESLRSAFLHLESGGSTLQFTARLQNEIGLIFTPEASRLIRQTKLPTFSTLLLALKRGSEEIDSSACFGVRSPVMISESSEGIPRHLKEEGAGFLLKPLEHHRLERLDTPEPLQSRDEILCRVRGILAQVETGKLNKVSAQGELASLGLFVDEIPSLKHSLTIMESTGGLDFSRALAACDVYLTSCAAAVTLVSSPRHPPSAPQSAPMAAAATAAAVGVRAYDGHGDLVTWRGVAEGVTDEAKLGSPKPMKDKNSSALLRGILCPEE